MRDVSTPAAERGVVTGDTAAAVEAAGHFRIYLGAAAGVGKTYAMLNEGHRRRQRVPASRSAGTARAPCYLDTSGRPPTGDEGCGLMS
jgi:K+-sensing histidine kinase KdpD